ncbi:Multidrug efflux pump subunit AcrB [Cnuella takakiae]|uniref:Multidrug efflux pump subunit AcrB n=1 Tax=Cnuella takakiae TaxID=1302690 RepID=A0A1M5IJM4_9BACT|nr:efflux RND transporter permease subunit [Cnuella takakiae]OLY92207.1 multidrug transporter AcrB [Cnuella takakiae]SHG28436.1 Multidrug efflux pump subunit AcrB [Cnuella takakiae]
MRFTSFFVRNYQFTLVVFLMIVVVSVATLLSMPRAEDPEINPPQFPIIVIYPGTSPKDMEELVVKPIEKKISELEDIKTITTRIDDGVAVLEVKCQYTSNVDDKYQELVREVNALRSELPQDLYKLEVKKVTPTDVNVLQVALVSENASDARMKHYAEELKEELEQVKSLKKVEYWGTPEPIVRIDLQLDKLAQLRIPLSQVIGAIQSEGANIPGGSIRAGNKTFNIKTSGNFKSLDEIASTIVYNADGSVVYLKDVADVALNHEEVKHITRLNGHRAVLVTAAQKSGQNISATQKAYLPILTAFSKKLPANIAMVNHFDQADNVSRRLGGLGIDFLIAIGLVLFTLIPLGWRAALVVMLAIPLSLGLGIIMLNSMGFSLNQLSIVGLVVALGLLVDDSIVVIENIERWLREGVARKIAVVEATKQITIAVLGTTATLIIAFLPIVFMPEASGEFIRGLPLAVITSVFASMLVSLTIVPFLASKVLKTTHNPEGNIFLRGLKKIIHGSYALWLDKALQRPVLTLIGAALLFVASLAVFQVIGFRLFPTSEKPQFLVNINMPLQSNLESTDAMARRVEAVLKDVPQVAHFTTNVGKGNPQIYYNEIQKNEQQDFAQVFVQLDKDVKPTEKKKLIERLREQFTGIAGAKIEVKDFEQGPPIDAPVAIRIKGENLDTLRVLAARTEALLRSVPGAIYVNNDVSVMKSDMKLAINTDKSRMLGIQTADIDRTVRLAVAGVGTGKFTNEDGDDFDIVVNTPKKQVATLASFNDIYVNNAVGTPVPLNQVADIRFESSPTTIKHLDKKRFVVVSAFTDKGVLAESITKAFLEKAKYLRLPEGYELELAGEVESEKEAFGGGFMTVVLATVFLFLMVLILEFKTFKSTLIVLSVIPLGVIGGVTMLWLTGNPMSFVAIIGFIGLAGVEVKNSILLVDFTNQLRAEGKDLDTAIREAGELRFLPIVLTSLTAIGGLLPIAISSNPLISPLALVLIGGLISSTLLSRIVTPVVYKLIPPKVEPVAV